MREAAGKQPLLNPNLMEKPTVLNSYSKDAGDHSLSHWNCCCACSHLLAMGAEGTQMIPNRVGGPTSSLRCSALRARQACWFRSASSIHGAISQTASPLAVSDQVQLPGLEEIGSSTALRPERHRSGSPSFFRKRQAFHRNFGQSN